MSIILATLFEPTSAAMPFGLGPVGTIITLFFLVLLGFLNVLQFRKRAEVETAKGETQAAKNVASQWQGTATAYEKELVVVRERCDRLEEQSKQQLHLIGELQGRTDLKPLMEIQQQIVKALQELSMGNADRYLKATEAIGANTETINQLGRHMSREFTQQRKAFGKMMASMEKKLSEQAKAA
jgi:hypothetical protein